MKQPLTPAAGPGNIARYIDHTLLKPDASAAQITALCGEAIRYKFASVCVNPCYASLVTAKLQGSGVKTCCVVGFPLGANTPEVKAAETRDCIAHGAREVDMVVNVGAMKSGDWEQVRRDISAVTEAARGQALVKVIIETCLLTDDEKVRVCTVAKEAGADFVKTSTGFSTGGATVEDIRLMRKTVGAALGVKASGGVRDYSTALAMIDAGATRIGTSNGAAIIAQAEGGAAQGTPGGY